MAPGPIARFKRALWQRSRSFVRRSLGPTDEEKLAVLIGDGRVAIGRNSHPEWVTTNALRSWFSLPAPTRTAIRQVAVTS